MICALRNGSGIEKYVIKVALYNKDYSDKITYFAANKATLRAVIEEGQEPYTDFRPEEEVSAMLSVSSINKRMVTSILLNGALNKLLIELDRTIKDKLGIPYDVNNI